MKPVIANITPMKSLLKSVKLFMLRFFNVNHERRVSNDYLSWLSYILKNRRKILTDNKH